VDHFSSEKVNALLTTFLNYTYGDEKWIEFISDLQMYLDHDLIEKKNLDLNKIRDVVSNFINEFEGVQVSMPAYQLEGVSSSNGMLEPLYNSYVKNRSGDILYSLKEGWQPSFKFKNVNFTDQTHIPLVFYGGKIPAKKISGKYSAIDFAPTISEFLHIPMPDKCQGEIIKELF